MPNLSALASLLTVLGSAFLGGLLARKLRQPIIFGYLLAGLVVSGLVEGFGLKREVLGVLAEIGSSLLVFTLGLEFSLKKITKIKKVVVGGAFLNFFLFLFFASFLLERLFNLPLSSAFILAGAFSISSSAIVVKLLEEKNSQESLSGEIMLGWLLVEDLAVLPLLIIFTLLFDFKGAETNLLLVGKALVLFLAWFLVQKVVPAFTDFVANFRSRELLLIFVLALVFLFALSTSALGFPFALGAFLAGLIFNKTNENFAIFSEIRPLRDIFLAIFFVSLGLSLEPRFLIGSWQLILLISLVVLTLKILLGVSVLSYFGYHAKTILRVAFGLAQAGEFSFALAATALAGRYLTPLGYSLTASVALLTMVLTPWLFFLADKIYYQSRRFCERFPVVYRRLFTDGSDFWFGEELPFVDHVVILGYGRVGKWIGSFLEKVKIPYLVVEYNPEIVRQLKLGQKKVVFGDPTDLKVLDFAQVDKAKLVVLAIPDPLTQKMVVANCRILNPRVEIFCRSHLEEDYDELKSMGVAQIIQPEFEAALSISHRILQSFGWDKDKVREAIKEIKREHG